MKRNFLHGAGLVALIVAGPALAADLKAPVYKAPVMAPWSWAGTYVGVNAGYGWASDPATLTDTVTTTSMTTHDATVPVPTFVAGPTITTVATGGASANVNGWLGGIQAGHNWQSNTFVYGLEGDIQVTGQTGSVTPCDTAGCPVGTGAATASYKLPWFGTLRGRLGFTPASRWLVYVTGGLAVAGVNESLSGGVIGAGLGSVVASNNTTRAGFVIGGGVESALTNEWSVKLEYLYMDFGSTGLAGVGAPITTATFNGPRIETITVATPTAALSTKITDNVVRLGLNYRVSPY
jgi:outer membrane immunogenic protein